MSSQLPPVKVVRITAARPLRHHVRVTDADTGQELHVRAIHFRPIGYAHEAGDLIEVDLRFRAVLDVQALVRPSSWRARLVELWRRLTADRPRFHGPPPTAGGAA